MRNGGCLRIVTGVDLRFKKILPVGSISYQGRTLNFTPSYIQGLAVAFRDRAYDQVSFQLADSANSHTNDPERHRGTIVDMKAEADGLYVVLDPTPRGEGVLRENPYLGVSARIVEQYARSDGKVYPAAIQHVLGTLDPRIPGLGSWQPIDMANASAVVIDLSNYSFAGEPGPAALGTLDELSDAELGDLLDAMDETGLLDGEPEPGDGYGDGYASAVEEFDSAFNERVAADAAREDARAAAVVEDMMHPARRDEDRMARIISRAQAGVYSGQQLSFAADEAAIELAVATGKGPCGVPDDFGRCSARFHSTDCAHQVSVDWLASGPPAATGEAALANLADRLQLDLSSRSVWGDPDDEDEPSYEIPADTIELAHGLADDWGLFGGTPGYPASGPMQMPAAPTTVYDELLDGAGLGGPAPQQQSWPQISELAKSLGLK